MSFNPNFNNPQPPIIGFNNNHLYQPYGNYNYNASVYADSTISNNICPDLGGNNYIYVNQNMLQPIGKVLINPNFRTRIHVNPNFKVSKTIHVNPQILKPSLISNQNVVLNTDIQKAPGEEKDPPKYICSNNNKKLIRVGLKSKSTIMKLQHSAQPSTLTFRQSRYKKELVTKHVVNKFKIDRRKRLNTPKYSPVSTKYVFIKNAKLCRSRFVKVNGKVFKFSPNKLDMTISKPVVNVRNSLLKTKPKSQNVMHNSKFKYLKAAEPKSKYKYITKQPGNKYKFVKISDSNKYKYVKKEKKQKKRKSLDKKLNIGKLKKCNLPCKIYQKYGKCPRNASGKCFKVHNPDQIALCTKFLRGACVDSKCLLSHNISPEKMPTCNYYLEGRCFKDDCPYLHVKVSPKADICKDFLQGFCRRAKDCDRRHQYLCPDYEKNNICKKAKCPYPHGNMVRNINLLQQVAKRTQMKGKRKPVEMNASVENCTEKNPRYYADITKSEEMHVNDKTSHLDDCDPNVVTTTRQKIGTLPVYIPLFESQNS